MIWSRVHPPPLPPSLLRRPVAFYELAGLSSSITGDVAWNESAATRPSVNQTWPRLMQIRPSVIQTRLLRCGKGHAERVNPAQSRSGIPEPRWFSSEHAKGPPQRPFFMPDCWGKISFFFPLLSEYQVRRIRRPTFFGVVGGEVAWNEGLHFGTAGEKLDKFSTFE